MASVDTVIPPRAFRVATAVTLVIAGWFALTFAASVGSLFLGT